MRSPDILIYCDSIKVDEELKVASIDSPDVDESNGTQLNFTRPKTIRITNFLLRAIFIFEMRAKHEFKQITS